MNHNLTVANIIKFIHHFKPINKVNVINVNGKALTANFLFVKDSENDKSNFELFYGLENGYNHVMFNLRLNNNSYGIKFPFRKTKDETLNEIRFYFKNKEYSLSNYQDIDDLFFVGFILKLINSQPEQEYQNMVFLNEEKLRIDLSKFINSNTLQYKTELNQIVNSNIKEANVEVIQLASETIYFDNDKLVYEPYVNYLNNVRFKKSLVKTKEDFEKNNFSEEADLIIQEMTDKYNSYLEEIKKEMYPFILNNLKMLDNDIFENIKDYLKSIEESTYYDLINGKYKNFSKIHRHVADIVEEFNEIKIKSQNEILKILNKK